MGEVKHTQGRLFANGNEVRQLIHENSGLSVAVARCAGRDAEAVANARLYAAAPDLLEALQVIVADCSQIWTAAEFPALKQARAAITRATAPMQEGE